MPKYHSRSEIVPFNLPIIGISSVEIRGYTYLSSLLRATVSTGADPLPFVAQTPDNFVPPLFVSFRHSAARGQAFVSTLLPLFDPLIKSSQAATLLIWFGVDGIFGIGVYARTGDISDVFHAKMELPSRNFWTVVEEFLCFCSFRYEIEIFQQAKWLFVPIQIENVKIYDESDE